MRCWACDEEALVVPTNVRGPDGKPIPLQLAYCQAHVRELHRTYEVCSADGSLGRWLTHYNGHIARHFRIAQGCLQAPIAEGMVANPTPAAGPSERAE